MLTEEFFYSIFWVSAVSVIWFYSNWFVPYSQLTGLFENFRLKFISFQSNNSEYNNAFPDFLYKQSLKEPNRFKKFLLKMVSCVFCLTFWLSAFCSLIIQNPLMTAPIYVCSLIIIFRIKSWI